jgi:hypothetical protein
MAIGSAWVSKHHLQIFDEAGNVTGRYPVAGSVVLVGFTLSRVTVVNTNSGFYAMFDDKAKPVSCWFG